jgi:hypothetical protein
MSSRLPHQSALFYSFSNLSKKERYRCRAVRSSSVDTSSPRSHCFSKAVRSLAKPSASRCINEATSLSCAFDRPARLIDETSL